jgi:hypothetical protein
MTVSVAHLQSMRCGNQMFPTNNTIGLGRILSLSNIQPRLSLLRLVRIMDLPRPFLHNLEDELAGITKLLIPLLGELHLNVLSLVTSLLPSSY